MAVPFLLSFNKYSCIENGLPYGFQQQVSCVIGIVLRAVLIDKALPWKPGCWAYTSESFLISIAPSEFLLYQQPQYPCYLTGA